MFLCFWLQCTSLLFYLSDQARITPVWGPRSLKKSPTESSRPSSIAQIRPDCVGSSFPPRSLYPEITREQLCLSHPLELFSITIPKPRRAPASLYGVQCRSLGQLWVSVFLCSLSLLCFAFGSTGLSALLLGHLPKFRPRLSKVLPFLNRAKSEANRYSLCFPKMRSFR